MAKKAPTVPQKAPQKPKVNRNPNNHGKANTFMVMHDKKRK